MQLSELVTPTCNGIGLGDARSGMGPKHDVTEGIMMLAIAWSKHYSLAE